MIFFAMVWQVDHVFYLQSLAWSAEMILLFLCTLVTKVRWSIIDVEIGCWNNCNRIEAFLDPFITHERKIDRNGCESSRAGGKDTSQHVCQWKGWEEGAEFRKLWSWVLISKHELLLYLELGKNLEIGQTERRRKGKVQICKDWTATISNFCKLL